MLYRACYGVLRFVMESGAKGCEVMTNSSTLYLFLFSLHIKFSDVIRLKCLLR